MIKGIVKIFILMMLLPSSIFAIEEFAIETGQPCSACHVEKEGGGELTPSGDYYLLHSAFPSDRESVKEWKPVLPLNHNLRLFIGFIHLLVGVVWFGAIFYIHIIIGPGKLRSGIPRQERMVGVISIILVGVTGILLTLNRVSGPDDFTAGIFGKVLAVKILLFSLMVVLAMVAVIVLHKKMSMIASAPSVKPSDKMSAEVLNDYDGKGDGPVYVAFKGNIYDVTSSKLWEEGLHMRRHGAGADLTGDMDSAPHGPEVLEQFNMVGTIGNNLGDERGKPKVVKVFEIFAFINLALALLILVCLAIWRWGLPEL